MRSRLRYALFGVLATVSGMAVAHFVAALLDPVSSPVLAVGSTVIDLTPTPLKEWAVRNFGTNDKLVLIGSVLAGTIVLAGIAGLLARKRFSLGAGLLILLVGMAGAAALTRPTANLADMLPSLVAGVVGVAVLGGLQWLDHTPSGVHDKQGGPGLETNRRVLLIAGGLVAAASAFGGAGQWSSACARGPKTSRCLRRPSLQRRSRKDWRLVSAPSAGCGRPPTTSTGSTPRSSLRRSVWTAGR